MAVPAVSQAPSPTPAPTGTPQGDPKPQADPKAQGTKPGASAEGSKPGEEGKEKDPKDLSSRFAALSRKERALVHQQSQVKAQIALITERESKVTEAENRIRSEISNAQSDPLAALKMLGWTYEDLTNYMLAGKKVPAEKQAKDLQASIDERFKKIDEREKKREDDARAQLAADEQQAIDDFRGSIGEFITAHPDEYELIKMRGPDAEDLVYQTVEDHFTKTKRILSVKEAADIVEQFLIEDAEKVATQSKKLSGKFTPKPKENAGETQTSSSGARTLTNGMSGSAAPSLLPASTEQERMRRAMAALGDR